jgi:hypothetical protein
LTQGLDLNGEKKSELDQIFFLNPILVLYLWLGFGDPLVLTFNWYDCFFACFANCFLFILFYLVSKLKQWFFFFLNAQAQGI